LGAFLLFGSVGGAHAQSDGRLVAAVERLEKRIADLEKRLADAERRAARAEKTARAPATASSGAAAPKLKPGELPPPGESGAARAAADGPVPNQVPRDVTPAEFNVFRQNVATLPKGGAEAAIGFAYSKNNSPLQNDRALGTFANLRYGLWNGGELSVTIPYYRSERNTAIGGSLGAFAIANRQVSSFGDVTVQLNALLFRETPDWPALVGYVRGTIPTGATRYNLIPGFTAGANSPLDPLSSRQSRGHWAVASGFEVYKTLDPIIVFFGAGVEYLHPLKVQGYSIEPSPRFFYNAGFSFAVSDRTTFGFSVNGSFERDLKVAGAKTALTNAEPIVARMVVVQRIAPDTYLEPSVAFGISADAPDAVLGVTLRRRF
jgi:hypothetical protein